jgi:TPR repeat protein
MILLLATSFPYFNFGVILKNADWKIRLLKIIAGILFLVIAYFYWEEDIYLWSCEEESVASSCYIVGLINEKNDFQSKADDFYSRACDMKYELACKKISR